MCLYPKMIKNPNPLTAKLYPFNIFKPKPLTSLYELYAFDMCDLPYL